MTTVSVILIILAAVLVWIHKSVVKPIAEFNPEPKAKEPEFTISENRGLFSGKM